jgi:hypothetical protein
MVALLQPLAFPVELRSRKRELTAAFQASAPRLRTYSSGASTMCAKGSIANQKSRSPNPPAPDPRRTPKKMDECARPPGSRNLLAAAKCQYEAAWTLSIILMCGVQSDRFRDCAQGHQRDGMADCVQVSAGWEAGASDQLIHSSAWRPLADPGAEIEGGRVKRADPNEIWAAPRAHEVGPVLDLLGVALARHEHDCRGIGPSFYAVPRNSLIAIGNV